MTDYRLLGDVLVQKEEWGGALQNYDVAIRIAQTIILRDPSDSGLQKTLAVLNVKRADTLVRRGNEMLIRPEPVVNQASRLIDDALLAYRAAADTFEKERAYLSLRYMQTCSTCGSRSEMFSSGSTNTVTRWTNTSWRQRPPSRLPQPGAWSIGRSNCRSRWSRRLIFSQATLEQTRPTINRQPAPEMMPCCIIKRPWRQSRPRQARSRIIPMCNHGGPR